MSSIHCLLGLPWWRKPYTLPSKTDSAKFSALPLVTCPKYCSFIRATFPINSLFRPISSNIDILVQCSFQEIPSIIDSNHSAVRSSGTQACHLSTVLNGACCLSCLQWNICLRFKAVYEVTRHSILFKARQCIVNDWWALTPMTVVLWQRERERERTAVNVV